MNEKEFGEKLRPWLERSARDVGDLQSARLKAGRLKALDAWREPVTLLGLVTVADGTAQSIRYSIVQRVLMWVPIIALVLTLAIKSDAEIDLGELDAQLLSQELPPDAFLDKDFRSWLGKSSG